MNSLHTLSLSLAPALLVRLIIFLATVELTLSSCNDYLDAKPEKSLQVPSSLDDLQALLDYTDDMNNNSPLALEACADDYYLTNELWNSMPSVTRQNLYIWEADVFNDNELRNDWALTYIPVYKANIVLETLPTIEKTAANEQYYNSVKGSALLFRARSFFEALQIWAKAYDENTAGTDKGIALRLTSDFNQASVRSTVQESYDRVIRDLKEAVNLLPVRAAHAMRPSRAAAWAYLARTYLVMRKYDLAATCADSCLSLKHDLIDYNSLTTSATYPFKRFNEEVIFNTSIAPQSTTTSGRIDSVLYNSYSSGDLRRLAFFKSFTASSGGGMGFKGSYYAANNPFTGPATDEMYLIRAECYARQGKEELALNDLNTLLLKRYRTGLFTPYTLQNAGDVLQVVLTERRKELLFRGIRWSDLKRLNKEPGHERTIRRYLNGKWHELLPNDGRYALHIPNSVIEISGIEQN